ncbi:MAG: efflux RND transporter periplasmic adaptor subunit [Acidobacteriota bacterium]
MAFPAPDLLRPVAALGLCALLSTLSCGGPKPEEGAAQAPPGEVSLTPEMARNAGVQVSAVRRAFPVLSITLTGSTAYDDTRTARVGTRLPGRVKAVVADFGSRVRAGDTLCILDSPELGDAQADYLTKLAQYRVSERGYERAKLLVENLAISQSEFLEREGAFQRARSDLAFAENRLQLFDMDDASVKALAAQVADGPPAASAVSPLLRIRAPISGTVTLRETSVGEVVDRLQTLYTVSDLGALWAWLDLYESNLSRVTPGDPVDLEVESLEGRRIAAVVDFIGPVETATRTARVRVRLPNPDGALRPGMFVSAKVRVQSPEEALLLPAEAVQEMEGRKVVFRERSPGTYATVPVTVGRTFDGDLEVLGGVSEGDRVVTEGAFAVKGQLLKSQLG